MGILKNESNEYQKPDLILFYTLLWLIFWIFLNISPNLLKRMLASINHPTQLALIRVQINPEVGRNKNRLGNCRKSLLLFCKERIHKVWLLCLQPTLQALYPYMEEAPRSSMSIIASGGCGSHGGKWKGEDVEEGKQGRGKTRQRI